MPRGKTAGWGGPEEVPVAEMGAAANRMARHKFMREMWLRLERTNIDRALRYTLTDEAAAQALRKYIYSRARREKGEGFVCIARRRLEDGTVAVYVSRGPNYKQGVPE